MIAYTIESVSAFAQAEMDYLKATYIFTNLMVL
jgi:hypothetical protein